MNESLNKKLLALQKSVRALAKNEEGYGYQYVSGSKLLYFIRPKMDELGLRLVPNTVAVQQNVIETVPADLAKNKPAKQEVLVLLHKTFTWIDAESGESETTDFYSQGCNGFDKGIGSAETYAERYFLLKYFHIATDEDDVDALTREPEAPTTEEKPKKKVTKPVKKDEPKESAEPLVIEEAKTTLAAVDMANKAKTAEELTAVWNANKGKYGSDPNFILAISSNPCNPKKR